MMLKELFDSGKFIVTSEVARQKDDISEIKEEAEHLRGKVDAINVTDSRAQL